MPPGKAGEPGLFIYKDKEKLFAKIIETNNNQLTIFSEEKKATKSYSHKHIKLVII